MMVKEKKTRQKILLVDDNTANVDLLEAYLEPSGYDILKAYDGLEGLHLAYEKNPDLILLDIMMPGLDGYEVCKRLKEDERTQLIPIVIITALSDLDDKIKGLDVGADDFLSKPIVRPELMARVRSLLRIKNLYDDLDSSENIIFTLALALEAKDPYTRGHSERVATIALSLARKTGLSTETQQKIHKAGILHDIGKIGVRESILNKVSNLNADEYDEITKHPSIGANICEPLKSLAEIIPMIRHHHERYDGKGHPDGLFKDDIPIGAMIIAIADTYDAMTSARPYRSAITKEAAFVIIKKEKKSGQLPPFLVDAFLEMMKEE